MIAGLLWDAENGACGRRNGSRSKSCCCYCVSSFGLLAPEPPHRESFYRNSRELSLFVLYVNEDDFESPWLWEQLLFDCLCLVPRHIHKSEPEPRNENTVCCIYQRKYSNQLLGVYYDNRARDCKCLFIFVLPA